MHVGFSLLTLFPGRVGGSESNVRGLLGEFADGNGPERVTVLANRPVAGAYGAYERGPVSIHEVRSYRAGNRMPSRALAMLAARALPGVAARDVPSGLDVVHYPVTVPIPRASVPTVVTIHDLQHHDLPGFFSRGERAYRRWAYDGAARGATLVVALSEHTRGRVVELLGVAPERVEVVYHGIDARRFAPAGEGDEQLLDRLDLPDRFVVYPANLWPHKNHERLIEAIASADRELSLVLSGQTSRRLDGLLELARRKGAAGRVRHIGYVEAETLAALYRAAVGMVFPSLYEGFGAPPLEAMACGCPVASSRRGSLGEVCGDAALELEPDSVESIATALDRIASDEDLRRRLRDAGLERAARFRWSEAARRHTEVYARAAAVRPS